MIDKTCLSYWYPILEASGTPTPKTVIIPALIDLSPLLDGETPDGFDGLVAAVRSACADVGYPAFLRTGFGSGKHSWNETCFVRNEIGVPSHIAALVEWGACVDMLGLPTSVWAVREFLRLRHSFTAFDGMPVADEYRFFVRDGAIQCAHPYWPPDSIRDPSSSEWRERLAAHNDAPIPVELTALVERHAKAFDGAWSFDWACTKDGRWVAIDMADAARSFHWPGCEHAPLEHDFSDPRMDGFSLTAMLDGVDE